MSKVMVFIVSMIALSCQSASVMASQKWVEMKLSVLSNMLYNAISTANNQNVKDESSVILSNSGVSSNFIYSVLSGSMSSLDISMPISTNIAQQIVFSTKPEYDGAFLVWDGRETDPYVFTNATHGIYITQTLTNVVSSSGSITNVFTYQRLHLPNMVMNEEGLRNWNSFKLIDMNVTNIVKTVFCNVTDEVRDSELGR